MSEVRVCYVKVKEILGWVTEICFHHSTQPHYRHSIPSHGQLCPGGGVEGKTVIMKLVKSEYCDSYDSLGDPVTLVEVLSLLMLASR